MLIEVNELISEDSSNWSEEDMQVVYTIAEKLSWRVFLKGEEFDRDAKVPKKNGCGTIISCLMVTLIVCII